jgi:hypothetical protein
MSGFCSWTCDKNHRKKPSMTMKAAAGIGRLSRWEDAWRRILADGYE